MRGIIRSDLSGKVVLTLCFLVCIAILFGGCAKSVSVNNVPNEQTAGGVSETPEGDFDVNANMDVEALKQIIRNQNPDQRIIDAEMIESIMNKHGDQIKRAARKYNWEYDQCYDSINFVVQDESECESDERTVLNILVEEQQRIEWLKKHGQKDIQRAMWRVLKGRDYYSQIFFEDSYNEKYDAVGALRQYVKAGADLSLPNWDGEVGAFWISAFAVYDAKLIMELIESGAVKYDVKDVEGNSLLHKYASNEKMFDMLIKSGLDINNENNNGQTPIFFVKDPQILEKYIKAGADINHTDHNGSTPIFYAVKNDKEHFPVSAEMVRLGADINHVNNDGKTAIFEVNSQNDLMEFVKLGAKLDVKDKTGNTLLYSYDISEDNETLDKLDLYLESGAEVKDGGQFPILKICVMHEYDYESVNNDINKLCVDKLVKAGVDITAKDSKGRDFLSYILENSSSYMLSEESYNYARNELKLKYGNQLRVIDVISQARRSFDRQMEVDEFSGDMTLLSDEMDYIQMAMEDMLKDGVLDVTEKKHEGETLLFYVTKYSLASALIKAGVDIDEDNILGQTALWTGNIAALVEAGADVNVRDMHDTTPLFAHYIYYYGTDWGSVKMFNSGEVGSLLNAGADINATDSKGRSVLFHVIEECDGLGTEDCEENDYCDPEPAVKFLADRGADVNIKDKEGITPLMLACDEAMDADAIETLLKAGADANAKDNAGRTVADHCKKYSAIVEILNASGK